MFDKKILDEYVEKHRKMWNWIAEQYKNPSKYHLDSLSIFTLKQIYLEEINHNKDYLCDDCYLCEYDKRYGNDNCDHCPLEWPFGGCIVGGGFYHEVEVPLFAKSTYASIEEKWDECVKLAEQIANLPVKEKFKKNDTN